MILCCGSTSNVVQTENTEKVLSKQYKPACPQTALPSESEGCMENLMQGTEKRHLITIKEMSAAPTTAISASLVHISDFSLCQFCPWEKKKKILKHGKLSKGLKQTQHRKCTWCPQTGSLGLPDPSSASSGGGSGDGLEGGNPAKPTLQT